MRKFATAILATASLTTASCGPGVPIELPEDDLEAAKICFTAKGMVLREGKSEGDAVTFEEFTGAIKYPMIAASRTDPFDINALTGILDGAEAIADDVASKDYAGAIEGCDARFKPAPLKLPEADKDAIISCTAMAGFLSGAVENESAEFGKEGNGTSALLDRLEAAMQQNPDLLVMLIQEDPAEIMNAALKDGFAQGDIEGYVAQCEKRYPAVS
ncbi:hypothetical protein [Pontixanthobacter aquaemixtae]|uniref:Lipoprotein n=1 Tax=Pontixanthobacter aquaemixtae TaxID=1958940 RepID=A0A844ZQZ6_9SPHN|nr:hypothetical protein [Pontixanthobacter aquaemixtae]MXO90741.1 hypothetical protein [Pontixanthobacter aquaemixtae]